MSTNKKKVTSNMIWRFLERISAQLVAFIVSIVIARILDPSAYGTIALIMVFTAVLQVFVDSGLGNALIQKKGADNVDFSTVFFTNIILCILLYIAIFLAAPIIAIFYDNLEMIPYIRVLGLTVVISGVKNVQQAYVSKNLLFRKFFFSTLGGTVIAGVVGIVMAINGMGIWALVVQQVVNLLIDTIILWITVDWRPDFCFSFIRLKSLFSYGWKLLVSEILDTAYRELRQLIIGKVYNPSDLAFYNQGEKIPQLIISNVDLSIDSVLFPVMSDVQDNKLRLKNITRKAIKTSTYIMAPLMMGLFFAGEPIIKILLTDKWLFAVPYMRIFCVTYMFFPIHTANLNALKAMGKSDMFLILEIIKKIVDFAAMIITMRISVMAMAYSLLVTSVISQVINSRPNKKLLNYGYLEQLKDIIPAILLAVFMGGCVYFVGWFNLPDIITLCLQVVVGVVIYVGISWLFKFESFYYVLDIAKSYVHKTDK